MTRKSLVVNGLTFARVPLIGAWFVLAILQENTITTQSAGSFWLAFWACAAMLFSGLTDAWDGRLARKWNVTSTFGKMADPLMDKVFFLVAFPTLTWLAAHQAESDVHSVLLLVLTIVYMVRDTWVTFLRSIGVIYGADVAAMWLGKVRTALSFPGAGWVYMYCCFHRMVSSEWHRAWFYSCVAVEGFLLLLTLYSLYAYTRVYSPYIGRSFGEGRK